MSDDPIAIFDSGVGSLSLIKALKCLIPSENVIYLADTANFPYGAKTSHVLRQIMINTVNSLEYFRPKLIIVASYTPSIQWLADIKKCTSIPVIGIIPPLDKAAKLSKKRHIGIMATESTLKSFQLDRLIAKEIPQKILVSKINASPLISTIEDCSFMNSVRIRKSVIQKILVNSQGDMMDVIVLSSTHLSLVKNYFDSLFSKIKFIDSTDSAAKEVERFLRDNNILKKSSRRKTRVLTTGNEEEFQKVLQCIGFNFKVEQFRLGV
jgi:glutamate racemase